MLVNHVLSKIEFSKPYYIVGIDGPTAVGKTFLADRLSKKLQEKNIPYFVYRLDWTLKARSLRESEISLFVKANSGFEYEADYHMDFKPVHDFLDEFTNKFNDGKKVKLSNLYNREQGGLCTGNTEFVMKQNMVLIVEGHYTHLPHLNCKIDNNILLLADPTELLKRKINRAGIYRDNIKIEEYFRYVDMPSFYHYSQLHYYSFVNIVNNTDYISPVICEKSKSIPLLEQFNISSSFVKMPILQDYFSVSGLRNIDGEKQIDTILSKLYHFDLEAAKLYGLAEISRQISFECLLNKIMDISSEFVTYCDFRKLYSDNPDYFICISADTINILMYSDSEKIRLVILSKFSRKIYEIKRKFADFSCSLDVNNLNYKRVCLCVSNEKGLYIPNSVFINAERLPDETKAIYTSNANPTLFIEDLLCSDFCLIHRCDNYREFDLWNKIFDSLGFPVKSNGLYMLVTAGNISVFFDKSIDYRLFSVEKNYVKDENPYFEKLLNKCGLRLRDGLITGELKKYKEFKELFTHSEQCHKKLILDWLLRNHSDAIIYKNINLKRFVENLPSYLSDYYFALSLRGNSAIPFFTVYDLRDKSLDVSAYFNICARYCTPFGIQASQNAIDFNDGYLKLEKPSDFAQKIEALLLGFLSNDAEAELPLWSLGIDHAQSSKNVHNNKTDSFISNAVSYGYINSVCLDFESVLDKANGDFSGFTELLNHLLGFLSKDTQIEIVTGEKLNLLGVDDFAEICQIVKNSLNYRGFTNKRFLLGPALGTLHHRKSLNCNPEVSNEIYNKCVNDSYVGNVLHGTSFASNDDVTEFVMNHCVRINFAGQYLNKVIESLPYEVLIRFGQTQLERKTSFYKNKDILDDLKQYDFKAVQSAIESLFLIHKRAMNMVSLTTAERDFFRDPILHFSEKIIDMIFESLPDNSEKRKALHKKTALLSASMIEVPDCDFIGGMAKSVYKAGIRNFHIDIGDGVYISRKICGLDKIRYLQENFHDVKINVHLMTKSPNSLLEGGKSLIQKYCETKISVLYIYTDSFESEMEIIQAFEDIKSFSVKPGILIKHNEEYSEEIMDFIITNDIHNLLFMGVESGRGGQRFNQNVLDNIRKYKNRANMEKYALEIEVDGGLTEKIVIECQNSGADILSGWSLFMVDGKENLIKTIRNLLKKINIG